jgi:hypothetical protein
MRMVVGLQSGALWEQVADDLRMQGAAAVTPPAPSLPDVVVADFADESVDELTARLAALPGVRYAEPDALQTGF